MKNLAKRIIKPITSRMKSGSGGRNRGRQDSGAALIPDEAPKDETGVDFQDVLGGIEPEGSRSAGQTSGGGQSTSSLSDNVANNGATSGENPFLSDEERALVCDGTCNKCGCTSYHPIPIMERGRSAYRPRYVREPSSAPRGPTNVIMMSWRPRSGPDMRPMIGRLRGLMDQVRNVSDVASSSSDVASSSSTVSDPPRVCTRLLFLDCLTDLE